MKKYDCSKTLDYKHEINRACKMNEYCYHDCPMWGKTGCIDISEVTQEDIDRLQRWSDEHPEAQKISKEERNFIEMFENVGGKRIFREGGDLFGSLNGERYELRQKWFQFIGAGESMAFEELLRLEVEEER